MQQDSAMDFAEYDFILVETTLPDFTNPETLSSSMESPCKFGGHQSGYSVEQDPWLQSTGVAAPPEVVFEKVEPRNQSFGVYLSANSETPLMELLDCEDYLDSLAMQDDCASKADTLASTVTDMSSSISSSSSSRHRSVSMSSGDSQSGQSACFLQDVEAMELMSELMDGDEAASNQLQVVPASGATSEPQLPMFEPQQLRGQWGCQKTEGGAEASGLPSSPISISSDVSISGDDCSSSGAAESSDRDGEIASMADYIKEVIGKGSASKPDDMSSKLKVHEVILVILLNSAHGNKSKDLRRILAFCDGNGRECSRESMHFKTLDTETMGLLWQKIKGNKKNNYDTFARAMRVRREKSEGYFDYLDGGKRSKKRIYRFGQKTMAEMGRMKRTLGQFSEPKACGY